MGLSFWFISLGFYDGREHEIVASVSSRWGITGRVEGQNKNCYQLLFSCTKTVQEKDKANTYRDQ